MTITLQRWLVDDQVIDNVEGLTRKCSGPDQKGMKQKLTLCYDTSDKRINFQEFSGLDILKGMVYPSDLSHEKRQETIYLASFMNTIMTDFGHHVFWSEVFRYAYQVRRCKLMSTKLFEAWRG